MKPGFRLLQVRIREEIFDRLQLERVRRGERYFADTVNSVLDEAVPHSRIVTADLPEPPRRRAKVSGMSR